MRCKNFYAILSSCLLFLSSVSFAKENIATDTVLPATALKPYGRYFIDQQQNLELISSAVHFGFSFTGSECSVYASINDPSGHNYLQYELDNVYRRRIKLLGGSVQQIKL